MNKVFSQDKIDRIIRALRAEETSIPMLATRFDCSRGAIHTINRKFKIRSYDGKKADWREKYTNDDQD